MPNPDPENENHPAIDNNVENNHVENNPAVMRIRAQEMAELNDQDNEDSSSDDNTSSDDSAIEIVNLCNDSDGDTTAHDATNRRSKAF